MVICRTHRAEGRRNPRQDPLVRQWIRSYEDDPELGRAARVPIPAAHFAAMAMRFYEVAQAKPQTAGERRRHQVALRDRALLLLAKSARLRCINLRKLTLGDVEVTSRGLDLTLRVPKAQGSVLRVRIPRARSKAMCPVDAWHAWLKAVPGEPSAPAFSMLDAGGRRQSSSVGPTDVCIALKRALLAVGIDPAPYTEESLAAG